MTTVNTPVSPKVTTAAGASAVAVAATTVGVWIVEQTTGVDVPSLVEGAIAVVITYAGTFAAGWLRPDPLRPYAKAKHAE